MEDARPRRSPTTWALLALVGALTALTVVSAARSVLLAAGVLDARLDPELRTDLAAVGVLDPRGLRVSEGMAAFVSVPVALTCLVLLLGLLRWRPWAREGALGVFGLTGLFLLVMSLNGFTQEPRGRHAGLGLLASLAVLGVAALVLSPPVRGDFERRQVLRDRQAREAATAARRARAGGAGS